MFKELTIKDFNDKFADTDKCLQYLSDVKWENGFICRKCGHTNYCNGKTNLSRRCTRCKAEESATAHTIFHRCKIDLTDAFSIAFNVCSNPEISTYELAKRLEMRQMTCWRFKGKIMDCIKNQGEFKIYTPEINA